jgi:hypothetical protein
MIMRTQYAARHPRELRIGVAVHELTQTMSETKRFSEQRHSWFNVPGSDGNAFGLMNIGGIHMVRRWRRRAVIQNTYHLQHACARLRVWSSLLIAAPFTRREPPSDSDCLEATTPSSRVVTLRSVKRWNGERYP